MCRTSTPARRRWSTSYLQLTHAKDDTVGEEGGWRGDSDHPMVNWVSAQSAPPMLAPYSAGSSRSQLVAILEEGHEDVKLARAELETLAAWIDLGVPYCGDYVEANLWTPDEAKKYERYLAKRRRLAAEDEANSAAWSRHVGDRPR